MSECPRYICKSIEVDFITVTMMINPAGEGGIFFTAGGHFYEREPGNKSNLPYLSLSTGEWDTVAVTGCDRIPRRADKQRPVRPAHCA